MKAKSSDFRQISLAERTRWATGMVLVEGEVEPSKHEGGQPQIWASWASWARTYGAVREEFLEFYHERHGEAEEPGSEAVYRAYLAGEDPSEAEVPVVWDYRPVLMGLPPVPMGEPYRGR